MRILDAAKYLIGLSKPGTRYEITPKKLQKILFYAQAWHLAKKGEPLFPNSPFQAWPHGPVNHLVYDSYRVFGYHPITIPNLEQPFLEEDKKKYLNTIWEIYGCYNADQLEALTHNEDPWIKARKDLPYNVPSNEVITVKSMTVYYSGVLEKVKKGEWNCKVVNPQPRLELLLDKEKPTANPLLRFLGTWQGDDFEECLQDVYKNRIEAKLN